MKVRAVTDLVVFHYHFLPGGVSSVVRSALRALRDHGAGIRKVTLVGAAFPEGGLPGDESEARVCPELGYRDGRDPSPAAAAAEGRRLGEELLRRFGSDHAVWWAHNHHLGRNPAFTQALLEVARSGRQRLILQIHDFPECGRYDNLARLRRSLAAPPYPIGPSVRYALINRRDLAALREAGIPGEHLHLLENPLEPDGDRAAAPAAEVRRALGLAGDGRPLLLYPVRCIRRKNVLEAALLCRLRPEPAGLAVTLPGISAEERGYSRRVQRAFARGWVPGVFGAGALLQARGLHLEDLFRASDLVLSASVQEGFGYLFLQSLAWGRPLLARDLDVLEGMRDLFAGRPVELYREVRAPLPARARRRLREAYRRKLDRLAGSGLLPAETTRALEGRLESACGGPEVEFSFLPAAGQLELLRAAGRETGLAARLRELNRGPLEALERLLAGGSRGKQGAPELASRELVERIQQRFGPERFAAAFDGICRSFSGPTAAGSSAPDEAAVWERVIRRFATVENVRLLHGD
jgi:glycosyltransferase involved in cell wall biosynthesis